MNLADLIVVFVSAVAVTALGWFFFGVRPRREVAGHTYSFCSRQRASTFDAGPDRYISGGA
ncbi:hypothetical protein [Streptomyces chiangmaiensis]|uniref:Secreted protein n=1 Tax=Streptomyces chiangmaiensis TaxID=766497 RepID=A0ABU7FN04_9ACTN|nr:hypothetical protein [Streptomyces chiangmaiensis]MED7825418.1 hypothetical protein [Streptomyces chiangmaiensis]